MKKIFFSIGVALTSFAIQSFAEDSPVYTRKIENVASFEKIIVADNINVMLVTEDEGAITVEGKTEYLNSVTVTSINGVLSIKSNNKNTAGKIMVYVPVKKLSSIEITGDSKVMSAGIIDAPELKVLVEANCKLGLQTTGKITIQHAEDFDFEFAYVKNPKLLKIETY